MSEKLFKAGQSLTRAYKKFDDFAQKGLIKTLKERFNKGKAPLSTSKELTVFDSKKALPSSKLPSTAKKIGKLGTLGKVGRIARAATPVGLGIEAGILAYKVATRTPEQKARSKALKTKLSKTSTKDYHKDLLKMSIGGETMLKNPKKADLDKDGKLSSYEKKRGKAIEQNMKAKKGKMMYANVGMAAKKVREKDMMKASMGKSVRGYGAARTSGMGLQDEQLPPGKSLDYYKDLM